MKSERERCLCRLVDLPGAGAFFRGNAINSWVRKQTSPRLNFFWISLRVAPAQATCVQPLPTILACPFLAPSSQVAAT
jgi:hypothetical protein